MKLLHWGSRARLSILEIHCRHLSYAVRSINPAFFDTFSVSCGYNSTLVYFFGHHLEKKPGLRVAIEDEFSPTQSPCAAAKQQHHKSSCYHWKLWTHDDDDVQEDHFGVVLGVGEIGRSSSLIRTLTYRGRQSRCIFSCDSVATKLHQI